MCLVRKTLCTESFGNNGRLCRGKRTFWLHYQGFFLVSNLYYIYISKLFCLIYFQRILNQCKQMDKIAPKRRKSDVNNLPSKHSSWWKRTEDVLETSWRRLQCNIFLSSKKILLGRRLEDVLKTFKEDVSQIRLEDVFKTSWKTKSVTLKTSSRRLKDVLENKKCLLDDLYNFSGGIFI